MKPSAQSRDTEQLPDTHHWLRTVDLKRDGRFRAVIQGIFALVALGAVAVALLTDLPLGSTWSPIVMIPAVLLMCLIYMAAHEATHGAVLQLLTKVQPSYTFRFPFLTTGSDAYLTPRSAAVIALAPSVIWGLALLAALVTLPGDYRLVTYVLVALNFAGSAGDYVEAYLVTRQPPDALVQDDGDKVHVFLRTKQR